MCRAYCNLGATEQNRQNYAAAFQWHMKDLKLSGEISDQHAVAAANGNLGLASLSMVHC